MPRSSAFFDLLFLTREIHGRLGAAAPGEVHLFAYLACLLSVFDGRPASDWGYEFTGLDVGAPFAAELQAAQEQAIDTGLITRNDRGLELTTSAHEELGLLGELTQLTPRVRYLKPACGSLLAFPVGLVRSAMSAEPGLRPVLRTGGTRPLLRDASLGQLYEHFDALSNALGVTQDLIVPATVWLKYLSDVAMEMDRKAILSSGS